MLPVLRLTCPDLRYAEPVELQRPYDGVEEVLPGRVVVPQPVGRPPPGSHEGGP